MISGQSVEPAILVIMLGQGPSERRLSRQVEPPELALVIMSGQAPGPGQEPELKGQKPLPEEQETEHFAGATH